MSSSDLASRAFDALPARARRKLALDDVVYFAQQYLPNKTLTSFQQEWLREAADDSVQYYELIAAVGHGKSYALTFVLPIWWLCRNPDDRILIASNTEDLAQLTISIIKEQLVANERLIADFGPFYKPGNKWTDSELVVIREDPTDRTPTLKAVGAGGSIEGFRPRRSLVDDLTDRSVENSPTKVKDRQGWIDEQFIPRHDPPGIIRVLSGRWTPKDIPSYWMAKPGMVVRVAPAIKPDGKALWPEVHPLEKLEKIKNMILSHAFSGRYLCDPKAIEGNRFKREWFQYFDLKDLPAFDKLDIVAGVDPSIGKDADSDLFSITIIARDRTTGIAYVVDHWAKAGVNVPEQYGVIRQMYAQWKPREIAVEDVHFQYEAYRQLSRELPITPLKPHGLKKENRIEQLAPFTANGTLRWRDQHAGVAELVYELLTFPDAEHDDRADSAEIAWRKLTAGTTTSIGSALRKARW